MPLTIKPLNTKINKPSSSVQPIGIFDSGVGGLSIYKCVKEQLPNEQLIYVADSLFAPYGDKSDIDIIKRVNAVADTLIAQNCKAIVIACNTATVIAIDQLRERVSIPIIGVEPAIKPAVQCSINNRIGILTTQATAKNKRFLNLVNKYKGDSNVYIQPCPGLVELIESNQLNSVEFETLLVGYLKRLSQKNIDTLVLGCTHYPFFTDHIKRLVHTNIKIMETALPVTEQLKRQLIKHNLLNNDLLNNSTNEEVKKPQDLFFSSNQSETLSRLMSTLLNTEINVKPLAN